MVLKRLLQLGGARLHFVEQTHVLNRDHGLIGEGGRELDLLVRERSDSAPNERDDADRNAFSQEGHAQLRTELAQLRDVHRIFGVFKSIMNMHNARLEESSPDQRSASRLMCDTVHVVPLLIGCVVRGSEPVKGSIRAPDGHDIRLA